MLTEVAVTRLSLCTRVKVGVRPLNTDGGPEALV